MIGESAAGGSVQPQSRLFVSRQLIEATPGRQERLREHVGGVIGVRRPAQRVREKADVMGVVQFLEP
jgi:hypothetical protein